MAWLMKLSVGMLSVADRTESALLMAVESALLPIYLAMTENPFLERHVRVQTADAVAHVNNLREKAFGVSPKDREALNAVVRAVLRTARVISVRKAA